MSGGSHRPNTPPRVSITKADRAYRLLEEKIVTLQLAPGTVLSEAALSEQLDFERTPVREALQRLTHEGLVIVFPRKGGMVTDLDPQKQMLLLEVRRELERLMARAGAVRATDDERRQFHNIVLGMEAAAEKRDEMSFMRLDGWLNTLIAEAAHNEYASRAVGLIHGLSRRFGYSHYKKAGDLARMARLHAHLARQIGAGQPDGAAEASDQLIDYVENFTRKTAVAEKPNSLSPDGRARQQINFTTKARKNSI